MFKYISFSTILTYKLTVIILLIPFPAIAVEILLGIELAVSVCILIYACVNKYEILTKMIHFFSIYSMAINIILTKNMLLGLIKDNQISIVSFLGNLTCQGNTIIGIVLIQILIYATVFLLTREKKISQGSIGYAENSILNEILCLLSKSLKRIIFMTIVTIILGIVIKTLLCESLQETLASVVTYTLGNVILYVIPLIIVTIASGIFRRKIRKAF